MHATMACNMPVLDAGTSGLSLASLVQRLATASTPLLVRGLLDHRQWNSQARALGNRSALLGEFGDEQMKLSVAKLLSNGPESVQLDSKKLEFMRESWGAVGGSVLGDSVERQVRAGEPRPRVRLADWVTALREGTAPPDSYVFQNVSGGPVAKVLAPLHTLWRDLASAQFAPEEHFKWLGADPPALTRLGVGGSGSGAPFHDHEVIALNVAFAGRKRWLVTRPCSPDCRIPFYQGGAAVYHPELLLNQAQLPASTLHMLSEGGDTWDCTQHPGEVVFIPARFLHATINLDESVAVAIQCDDGADSRAGLAELNSLIVHANGAAAELGPCGIRWDSPFGDISSEKALEMLEMLPDSFRGDPRVFLNRPHISDGRTPVDVAVDYGSAHVASILVKHGAKFLPRHAVEAQNHGHAELATLIDKLLKSQTNRAPIQ